MKRGILLISIILAEKIPLDYCNELTCVNRGVFDTQTALFTPNALFTFTALAGASHVTVKTDAVATVAENLGSQEDLRISLTSSGNISGLSLHLMPGSGTHVAVTKPELVPPPVIVPTKKEDVSKEEEPQEPSFLKKYWWAVLLLYVGAQLIASSLEDAKTK